MEDIKAPIDIVGLRERLKGLKLDELEQAYTDLGIADVWKKGANKALAVETAIKAVVERQSVQEKEEVIQPTPVVEKEEVSDETGSEDEVPEGEYEVDQDVLDEYPHLVEMGFNIGDTLVVESGKPWSKKVDVEDIKVIDPIDETAGIVTEKTIEEADELIKGLNNGIEFNESLSKEDLEDLVNGVPRKTVDAELAALNGGTPHDIVKEEVFEPQIPVKEVIGEYVPEVIDETLYTEEELEENIEICTANCNQAIPETRIFLLRKIDALTLALERKRK
jgi:hypothetical protein